MSDRVLLLDTNVVVAFLRNRPPVVRERLTREWKAGSIVAVSSVTMFELWHGATRSDRPSMSGQQLRDFVGGEVDVIAFSGEDAEIAGALRARLERAGTPIGPYDLFIAAQGLRTGYTLVTANVGEFSRVPDLTVEIWSLPA